MTKDSNLLTTVVIVPRETFSTTIASVENVLESLAPTVPVVVVDCGYPREIHERLEAIAQRRPFTLVTANRFISPNQARNLGQREVATKYVSFVDNDVLVEPGWLAHLEACAEETGAWGVGPLCLKTPGHVHAAGGKNHIEQRGDGRRVHIGRADHDRAKRSRVEAVAQRCETEMFEFHCVLIRNDVFEMLGPLDEGLRSLHEYFDFCLTVREAGGSIWFEPSSVVIYGPPKSLSHEEKSYWYRRWSDQWNEASISRFAEKWQVDDNDGSLKDMVRFGRYHRRLAVRWIRKLPAGMAPKARAERAVFRCWARVYETVMYVRSMPQARRQLTVSISKPSSS